MELQSYQEDVLLRQVVGQSSYDIVDRLQSPARIANTCRHPIQVKCEPSIRISHTLKFSEGVLKVKTCLFQYAFNKPSASGSFVLK